jgi:MFS family permease
MNPTDSDTPYSSEDDPAPLLADAPAARADPYVVWRSPEYRRYAASWFLMAFAKMVETVAIGVYIYERTGDTLSLGWIGLAQALPFILLAIPGGQIADRYNRRNVVMGSLAVNAAVSTGLMAAALGDVPVAWLYLLLFVGAISQSIGSPSRAALLPQIVPGEIFANAITWNSTIFHIASMVGPAIGGLILGKSVNAPAAFALVVACRLVSLVAITGVRGRPPGRDGQTISLESLVAGVRFVWRTKLILATITLDLFAVLFGGATYLLPAIAKDVLGVGPAGLGYLRSAEAVGAVTMAMLIAHLPPMQRAGRTLLWAVSGFGAATLILGISQTFWLSLAMMVVIGALDNVSVVVRHTLVQMLTPDEMRGRVSAVNSVFIVASNDLGGLESGMTAWAFGLTASIVGGGIGTILVVVAAARIWPQILAIGSLAEIRPPTAAAEQVEEELTGRG